MMGDVLRLASLVQIAALLSTSLLPYVAYGNETKTYAYDPLGRLASSATSGGPNNGINTTIALDPGGNREQYAVGAVASSPTNAATVSIANAAAVNPGQPAVFTLTKSGTASGPLRVNFNTADGSGTTANTYQAASGTLTFLATETSKSLSISTVPGTVATPARQFSVVLSAPSAGMTIGTGTATGTVNAYSPAGSAPPPVANGDAGGSVGVCLSKSINVIANDTDPNGNYPLTLVSVGTSPLGDVSVQSSTNVLFSAYGSPGNSSFSYVVRNSAGVTATGNVTISVTNGSGCN